MVTTFWRRLLLATILWVVFWPILWFFRLGDITGHNTFFWLIGEMNYPGAVLVFILVDRVLTRFGLRAWMVFLGSAAVAALSVPFYYHRLGFPLGVFLDAYLF